MALQDRHFSNPRRLNVLVCGFIAMLVAVISVAPAVSVALAQETAPRFGGAYAELDARRQRFVDSWVGRFSAITGQKLEPGAFYDELLSLSTKTTFDAVTHALMTTALTDQSGASLGDALALVEQVDSIKGEVAGASGDRQFRMYVRLVPGALDTLRRAQQFKRGVDNAVYHKGFPINYREQRGVPSIQFSIALDGRRADIDVDYRASSFPAALFNGHLTSSNSDVRAGNNFDRHLDRWTGFQNWWASFFGVRQERSPEVSAASTTLAPPKTPRAGKQNIDVMVNDFLTSWLIEGDVVAAMGYVSARSFACLAQDSDNPADFDRGLARYQLMVNLKSAYESLGPHTSLEGLTVGTRLVRPGLRVVTQPHHAQFVVYSVPDDVAAAFDCENRLTLGDPKRIRRAYGNYFGSTFYINGRRDYPVALLWAREEGFWKVVSWKVGSDEETRDAEPAADPTVIRISADSTLVQAARGFLETWLIRKDYDAAFAYLSPLSYACYDLERNRDAPPSTSPEDAGRRIRAGLEAAGQTLGPVRSLDAILSAAEPVHPTIRVMNHQYARVFGINSVPNALADAVECAARVAGSTIPDPMPLEYGNGFGVTVRFLTRGGDAPVLRLLWRKEAGVWRITSYGVELP